MHHVVPQTVYESKRLNNLGKCKPGEAIITCPEQLRVISLCNLKTATDIQCHNTNIQRTIAIFPVFLKPFPMNW